MTALTRALSRALAPPLRAWRAWWHVDPAVAASMHDPAAFIEWLAAAEERNAAAHKRAVTEYASAHILPRVAFEPGSILPRLLPRGASEGAPRARGLSPFNHNLVLVTLAATPVILTLVVCVVLDRLAAGDVPRPLPQRSTYVLDARIAALEKASAAAAAGDVDAGSSSVAPPPAVFVPDVGALEARLAALEAKVAAATALVDSKGAVEASPSTAATPPP